MDVAIPARTRTVDGGRHTDRFFAMPRPSQMLRPQPPPTANRCNLLSQTAFLEIMPRFYFHLHDGVEVSDEEGAYFSNVESAREEAVKSVREILAEEVMQRGQLPLSDQIEVFDESGTSVFKMTFEDAVEIRRD